MATKSITLFVDVISPMGFMAFWLLKHSTTFSNIKITYIPVSLGALHQKCKITAPIFSLNKDKYTVRDRNRMCEQFSLPMRKDMPKGFPAAVQAHLIMRSLVTLQQITNDETFVKALEICWTAIWQPTHESLSSVQNLVVDGDFNFKDPQTLPALLSLAVDKETAEKCIKRDQTAEKAAKDILTKNTQQAFDVGAFGLPWLHCTNGSQSEGYFGFDHMGQVVRFLGLDGNADLERSGSKLKALL